MEIRTTFNKWNVNGGFVEYVTVYVMKGKMQENEILLVLESSQIEAVQLDLNWNDTITLL